MLTSKQRAYLIGLSHQLDPVVSVGKNGITPEAAVSTEEAFNTRELLKGAVMKMAPVTPREAAETLAQINLKAKVFGSTIRYSTAIEDCYFDGVPLFGRSSTVKSDYKNFIEELLKGE